MKSLPFSRSFDSTQDLTILLYLGSPLGWQAAKSEVNCNRGNVLLLPAFSDPDEYQWPVNARRVFIVDYEGVENGRAIGKHLMYEGASEVWWSLPDRDVHFVHEDNSCLIQ